LINLEINKSFITKEKMGALFLDIKAAYDNWVDSSIFDIINKLKIPIGYKKFIKNLLSFRYIDIYESGNFQLPERFIKASRKALKPSIV